MSKSNTYCYLSSAYLWVGHLLITFAVLDEGFGGASQWLEVRAYNRCCTYCMAFQRLKLWVWWLLIRCFGSETSVWVRQIRINEAVLKDAAPNGKGRAWRPISSRGMLGFSKSCTYHVYDQFDPDALEGTREDGYDRYCICIEVMRQSVCWVLLSYFTINSKYPCPPTTSLLYHG